jgi:F-type H+-transporting ATPase subunit epsilon
MATFQFQIHTQEAKVFDEPVESIVVPAETGYLGVLAHHAPLVATLGSGDLTIRKGGGKTQQYRVAGGFLEVRENVATLLVDELEQDATG